MKSTHCKKYYEEKNNFSYVLGESGVKIGIAGSGEPELQDFGDLYANFMYSGSSGTMEVRMLWNTLISQHKIFASFTFWGILRQERFAALVSIYKYMLPCKTVKSMVSK